MSISFKLPRNIGWVTGQEEPGVQARSLVDERFDAVAELVASAKTEFDDAVTAMSQSISPIVVASLADSGITVPDLGVEIPAFTGVFDKTFVATRPEFDVVYVEPGDKPDASLAAWEDATFSLEPELVDKVAEWIAGGSSAIPAAVAQSIYEAAIIRVDEARALAVAKAESDVAARGWELPSGVLVNQKAQIEREYAKGISEISGKIAERDMELTQANMHKAAELASAYVGAAMDYVVKKNTAKMQWYTAAVEAWVQQVTAAIKVIDAKVSAFNGQVEAYKAEGIVYKTEADVFDSTVRAYSSLVDGLKARGELVAETVRLQLQKFQADSGVAIEEERLKVQAQTATQTMAQGIAQAQAQLHAQTVASGLSAMHVQASVSASHGTGQDVKYSYSYGEDYRETQSIEEQTTIAAK